MLLILLTWINFDPGMEFVCHEILNLSQTCDGATVIILTYTLLDNGQLSMLGYKLIHVKMGPGKWQDRTGFLQKYFL